MDYCHVFNSHSDGTHSLQRIGEQVMLNFFKSVLMKNQTHLYLGLPEYFFSKFWVNYPFNEIKGHSARLPESYCGLISEAKKTYMITLHKAASVPQS